MMEPAVDSEFWKGKWRSNDIGFHEGRPNPLLARYWPSLGMAAGAPVFVPLCGKSVDMVWLAAQGHRVLGVELSDIAVRDFFAENGLEPERESRDGFEVSKAGQIEIWCGDYFRLTPQHLEGVAAVYDRASLVAMPPTMQPGYAAKLIEIVPPAAPILLLTFDYDQTQMSGPPFSTPAAQVHALFDHSRTVTEIDRRNALPSRPDLAARGLTRAETPVFVLRRR